MAISADRNISLFRQGEEQFIERLLGNLHLASSANFGSHAARGIKNQFQVRGRRGEAG